MRTPQKRTVDDALGTVTIPAGAWWGAQTQRALENGLGAGPTLPLPLIHALGQIKRASAEVHGASGRLESDLAAAVSAAAQQVAEGRWDDQFPLEIFQTGSGTSTHMNVNEVIAGLATERLGRRVHPNDHVNLGQSSNDVFPSALNMSLAVLVKSTLLPTLEWLASAIHCRSVELADVVKTGRTHLMDAMPITFGQELSGWAARLAMTQRRLGDAAAGLYALPLGGTAVGTGVNAPPGFARAVVEKLATRMDLPLILVGDHFAAQSGQDAALAMSGALRGAATVLLGIADGLRWMNAGPDAGPGEISLPALQPGSSIMPGKVNPTIPETVIQAMIEVLAGDMAVAQGAAWGGHFQLNVTQPLIAHHLHRNLDLLVRSARLLGEKAVVGFTVRSERIAADLARNSMLATALTPEIGYDRAAAIAKRARKEYRTVREVATEMTEISPERLDQLLDPARLARSGDGS